MNKMQQLINELKELEERVADEVSREAENFGYSLKQHKVSFEKEISTKHKLLTQKITSYLFSCTWPAILMAPFVYAMAVPTAILDVCLFIYQALCFPVYGIKKAKRSDYLAIDRHKLQYLNTIEKINCVFCSYVNGVIAYAREIASRSEAHWCPIKHARRLKGTHNRYNQFLPFGDAEGYVNRTQKPQ